jgi:putative sigma-54 modulation protein
MVQKVETVARNMRLTDNTRDYVEKKAAKLEHLQERVGAVPGPQWHRSRFTAKALFCVLERADDIHAAFDTALDKIQRQIDRYKGKHYHGRGDGRSAAEVAEEELPVDVTGELLPLIGRRKKFIILPMTEDEAVEQMRLLGHDNFFVFFYAEQNAIQVLYRRRNGTYG